MVVADRQSVTFAAGTSPSRTWYRGYLQVQPYPRDCQGCKVDACVSKRLIGWCKDREWTITLQRLEKFCLNDAGNQRIVLSCALCSPWNVVWRIGWHEDLVDDMDDPVACATSGK